jgi:3-hydroxybutyryl-CoA dehydrogenase
MKPKHVTIVGLGTMGCDIAAIFLAHGCDVHAVLPRRGVHKERASAVASAVRQLGATDPRGELVIVSVLDEVPIARSELVIETVPENLALKRQVFAEIMQRTPKGIPVTSNASGYRISDIVREFPGQERAAGAHFFLPAHLVPLVEVVRGERTDDETMERVVAIMKAVGRAPVRVNRDTPGFLANRIQHALMREAFAVIDEGLATPEDVDAAVRFGFGFRYVAAGPILQKEMAGLDTQLEAGRTIYPCLCTSSEPSPGLQQKVSAGRLGMKNGKGFWDWTPEEAARVKARYQGLLQRASVLLRENPFEKADAS